jgi:tetratricopeptide (TPR) repeat protein
MHDAPALAEASKAHDARFPGDALPQLEAGAALSFARQYNESRAMLSEAIRRRPNWSAPRVELGLMLMQQGDEQAAFTELTRAVALDPFNTRAVNQHKLAQQLLAYEVIRTKHFVIKYRAGIDQVLARDIAREVEALSDEVTAAFQHRPANPTIIELLPDASAFAVRITGIPELWTIAACTGDVVAMAPPREGAGLKGRFDWYTVLRHEYTHTVTLDQTANRIPHWLTEACAVSQEPPGRDYDTARLLAHSLHENELFDLKSINWAFVRPRRPNDRQLAYAQAAWMLEFLVESHGREALIRLLRLCKENPDVQETLQRATGRTPADFMTAFRQWAAQRVLAWGLGPTPADPLLHAAIKAGRLPDGQLAELLRKHPGQPDLLRLRAEALLDGTDPAAARAAVLEHQKARPVDPWSHKALVQLGDRAGDLEPVIDSLRELDRGAGASGAYANQIADLHRAKGRLDLAADALRRALHREPFHAGYREQIAAIELQRGDAQAALFHLQALPLLEPKRALHHLRIAALSKRLGQDAQADAAARRAIELDAGLQSQARAFLMN